MFIALAIAARHRRSHGRRTEPDALRTSCRHPTPVRRTRQRLTSGASNFRIWRRRTTWRIKISGEVSIRRFRPDRAAHPQRRGKGRGENRDALARSPTGGSRFVDGGEGDWSEHQSATLSDDLDDPMYDPEDDPGDDPFEPEDDAGDDP